MMQQLNFCRQLVKQAMELIKIPSLPNEKRSMMHAVIDLSAASQKFLLPYGGRLHDDKEYRALDEATPLRLPHPFIAIEYATGPDVGFHELGSINSTKRIIFAREREDMIAVLTAWWNNAKGVWVIDPQIGIPLTGYLDRTTLIDGYTGIRVLKFSPHQTNEQYADEIGALLCFLNALQCANVHTTKLETKRSGKKAKSAIQFDEYHILTIDIPGQSEGRSNGCGSSHRSPREHLRRGHIRRLENGKRIWVNAALVNAGRGFAKVSKDYLLRDVGKV